MKARFVQEENLARRNSSPGGADELTVFENAKVGIKR